MENLETENLILRPFFESDADRFLELLKDPGIKDLLEKFRFKEELTLVEVQYMLRYFRISIAKGDFRYAIIGKESSKLIGGLLAYSNKQKTSFDVMVFIDNNLRRKGYAKEAVLEFIEHAKTLGYKKIYFQILKSNTNPLRLLSSIQNMNDLGIEIESELLDNYGYKGDIVEEKDAEVCLIDEQKVVIVWGNYDARIFSPNGQIIGNIKIEADNANNKIVAISNINDNIKRFEMSKDEIIRMYEEGNDAFKYIKNNLYTLIDHLKFKKYQNGECIFDKYADPSLDLLYSAGGDSKKS